MEDLDAFKFSIWDYSSFSFSLLSDVFTVLSDDSRFAFILLLDAFTVLNLGWFQICFLFVVGRILDDSSFAFTLLLDAYAMIPALLSLCPCTHSQSLICDDSRFLFTLLLDAFTVFSQMIPDLPSFCFWTHSVFNLGWFQICFYFVFVRIHSF